MEKHKKYRFSSQQVQEIGGPGVYLWKSTNGVVLYAGASAYGLGRALGASHIMRRYTGELCLTFIVCETANEAFDLETQLITEHNPKYNSKVTGGQGCGEELPTLRELELRKRVEAGKNFSLLGEENVRRDKVFVNSESS